VDDDAVPPRMTVTATVLEAPDPRRLAAFYRALLGWSTVEDGPTWVVLRPQGGGAGLSFQREPGYVRPTWPSTDGRQQMMAHLDIEVDDLDAAVAHAVGSGATVAAFQPQYHVRVCLDPDGHPFCLYVEG
jgi:catechol 2,3-dioxygenase-like lactoylglutathione lyase family enzyme